MPKTPIPCDQNSIRYRTIQILNAHWWNGIEKIAQQKLLLKSIKSANIWEEMFWKKQPNGKMKIVASKKRWKMDGGGGGEWNVMARQSSCFQSKKLDLNRFLTLQQIAKAIFILFQGFSICFISTSHRFVYRFSTHLWFNEIKLHRSITSTDFNWQIKFVSLFFHGNQCAWDLYAIWFVLDCLYSQNIYQKFACATFPFVSFVCVCVCAIIEWIYI